MSPLDILAAARRNQVGPFLPAREEWLAGWTGPLLADIEHYGMNVHAVQTRTGDFGGFHEVHFRHGGVCMDAEIALSCIRLDPRRPEVRDHLVRCGCPAWARELPVAVWCWGMGVGVSTIAPAWTEIGHPARIWERLFQPDMWNLVGVYRDGWNVYLHNCRVASGPETGPEGRACADLAAICAGCVLEEADGWYVPLLGGGVGWWAKEAP